MRLRDVPLRYRCSSIIPAPVTFSIVIIQSLVCKRDIKVDIRNIKGGVKERSSDVPLLISMQQYHPSSHFSHRYHPNCKGFQVVGRSKVVVKHEGRYQDRYQGRYVSIWISRGDFKMYLPSKYRWSYITQSSSSDLLVYILTPRIRDSSCYSVTKKTG